MSPKGYSLSLFLLVPALISCRPEHTRFEINDLIQPVRLQAGFSDTLRVSDLFYAPNYDLIFHAPTDIQTAYDRDLGLLVLRPPESLEGWASMRFDLEGRGYVLPLRVQVKQRQKFRFKPPRPPEHRLNLMGNFNDWNRSSLPMSDEDGDGIYEVEVLLEPGQYLYQFVYDDRELWDPENPVKVDNGFGSFNSVVVVPPRHDDQAFLHILDYSVDDAATRLRFVAEVPQKEEPLSRSEILALLDNQAMPEDWMEIDGAVISLTLRKSELAGLHTLRLAVTRDGVASNMQTIRLIDGRRPSAEEFLSWHDATLYSLMIDRFFDGDPSNTAPVQHDSLRPKANYMGGDLQGVLTKLREGYFDSLGVNAIWLSPVNENSDEAFREWPPPHRYFSAYHGYWPTHHKQVESRFGDLALLREVVREAHGRGFRILLDFTANHVHRDHPFFSEHRDWFGSYDLPDGRKNMRLWDEFRLTTWFEPFLPSFDYVTSEAAREAMTDNAIWWLQETGADGFRHDAVKHIPNNFWRSMTRKIKEKIEVPEGRRIYQIGETFGSYELISSYVNNGQLSAQFNFNLYDTALLTFLNEDSDFAILAHELEKTFAAYGTNHLMGNVMDSHDKVRYAAYADGDLPLNSSQAAEVGWHNPPAVDNASTYAKLQVYLAYLMSIPGVPTLYYGDEFGMSGAADPDNRRMMRFGEELSVEEQRMLAEVAKLTGLRRKHSALRRGDFQTLQASQDIFAFLRSDLNERLLVVLNKSNQSTRCELQLPDFYKITLAQDLLTGKEIPIDKDKLDLEVASYGWQLFTLHR